MTCTYKPPSPPHHLAPRTTGNAANSRQPLRIAFVLDEFPALSHTFILNQITGLLELGCDVHVFPHRPGQPELLPTRLRDEINSRTHPWPPCPTQRLTRALRAAQLLRRGTWRQRWHACRLYWREHRSLSPELFHWLLSFLDLRLDLVHAHFGPNGNNAILLKSIGLDLPVVTTFHGYDVNCWPRQAGPHAYDRLFRQGDLFTCNTPFTKNRAIQIGCPQERIIVHPMGLDLGAFPFEPKSLRPSQPVRLLTVARLVENKGHQYALDALAILAKRGLSFNYDIAGDGPLLDNLKTQTQRLNLLPHVRFLGPCPPDKVPQLYQDAHLFLLPCVTASDGAQEGQGLVLQEAQACGLPVISTLGSGVPDGVLDGQSGLLVPERDTQALADAIEKLAINPQKWPEMGQQGRQFVQQKYDIRLLNRRLVEIYRDLLAHRLP